MKIIDINGIKRECVSVVPDKAFPGFMKVEYKSKIRKDYTHSEWYPIADFVKNNPRLAHLAKGAPKPPKEDLGIVSKATTNSLYDKTKKWRKNIFAGYPLWISRGKGEGQTRTILSNDARRLTIDKNWDVIPDRSSQYVISFNIHDPQVLGNILPGMDIVLPVKKKVVVKKAKKKKLISRKVKR